MVFPCPADEETFFQWPERTRRHLRSQLLSVRSAFLCFHPTIVFNQAIEGSVTVLTSHWFTFFKSIQKKLVVPVLRLLFFLPFFSFLSLHSSVSQCVCALGCGPHYELAIEELCLAKFRLDMQELDQKHWCSWEDTVEWVGETHTHNTHTHTKREKETQIWTYAQNLHSHKYKDITSFMLWISSFILNNTCLHKCNRNVLHSTMINIILILHCWSIVRWEKRKLSRQERSNDIKKRRFVHFWLEIHTIIQHFGHFPTAD